MFDAVLHAVKMVAGFLQGIVWIYTTMCGGLKMCFVSNCFCQELAKIEWYL